MEHNMVNFDEELLTTLRVDPTYNEPIDHQILRIALYDEFHAYETYKAIVQKFGMVNPFANIIQSEENHINMLLPLFDKYGVPVPVNNLASKVELPNSFIEACEIGVASEIDNIMMYDNLLQYSQFPDITDTLFRLQAASYNNHLPTFRSCVAQQYSGGGDINAIHQQNTLHTNSFNVDDFQKLIFSFMQGDIDQNQIIGLFQNSNKSFLGGLVAGGIASMLFKNRKG
jgi:rubrerythrin